MWKSSDKGGLQGTDAGWVRDGVGIGVVGGLGTCTL